MQNKQHGFSLVELLIVVAIILVIAAIAIPNLMRSRMAANEAGAVHAIRLINNAELSYSAANKDIGYTCSLATLGGTSATDAYLLDPDVSAGAKQGYNYSLQNCSTNGSMVTSYQSFADPLVPNSTGQRHFCSDPSGVIRFDPNAACVVTSSSAI
jgi:type IV pilus assembly protein PilA